jgi:hypothetical protein
VLELVSKSFKEESVKVFDQSSNKREMRLVPSRVYGVNRFNTLTWRNNNDYACLRKDKVDLEE